MGQKIIGLLRKYRLHYLPKPPKKYQSDFNILNWSQHAKNQVI